jgi:hypothetical protein
MLSSIRKVGQIFVSTLKRLYICCIKFNNKETNNVVRVFMKL